MRTLQAAAGGTTPGRGGAPEVLRHGTDDTTQVWPRGSCAAGASKFRIPPPYATMRHEKVHAVVARSTFPSQNGQKLEDRTTFGS